MAGSSKKPAAAVVNHSTTTAANPSSAAAAAVESPSTATPLSESEEKKRTTKGKETAAAPITPSAADEKKTTKGKVKDKSAGVDSSSSGATAVKEKPRKTKLVRMSQSQIDLFLSYNPEPLDPVPNMSQEYLDSLPEDWRERWGLPLDRMAEHFAEIDAKIEMFEKELLEEKEMIRKQYEEKGYVECEVYDDGENRARVPRPGRRRARSGLVINGGRTKRLN